MSSKEIIKKVLSNDLTQTESATIMQDIFMSEVTDQEIEDFLTSLSKKGETSDELTGAVLAMRNSSLKVKLKSQANLVDCCGTGNGKSMMNISTASPLLHQLQV